MGNRYAGLFFTSLAALMLEILLTRVLSVATWYYFAFFAISVAMFGFTVGALAVYLFKNRFPDDRLDRRLFTYAVLFGVSIDISLMVFLSVPFYPRLTGVGVFSTVLVYLMLALPFTLAGIVVCLCLTRIPEKTGPMYAADLIGAGLGAFLIFPVLNAMDAPTAIFLTGALAALGGVFFSRSIKNGYPQKTAAVAGVVFLSLTAITLVNLVYAPVRVEWVKRNYNNPEIETWNAFSRIAVYPLKIVDKPYSWGLSAAYEPKRRIAERMIDIDGVSETVMTKYNGDPATAEHLKYDVTSIAHYVKRDAKVFVIGVGGGRDILASLAFGQKSVTGAEINNRTIEMLTDEFGDFTGHLDKLPNVTIINDEARSALARTSERFDIIQASCIATWSATTAGAFSLAENSLYTVEAWRLFLERLNPGGLLSFNRWYSPDYPAQLLRLASLASFTLKSAGVNDPSRHIAIVRSEIIENTMPSGTILIKKEPFTEEEIARLREASVALKFKIEFDPAGYQSGIFKKVIAGAGEEAFHEGTRVDLTPSTDDRPFFFYMLRVKDLFSGERLKLNEQRFNVEGVRMLFILLGVSVALSVVFIFGPLLWLKGRANAPKGGALKAVLFFAAIGFGYMLVEIAQLQRLIIFLGHPVYSITVVIFAMLTASGIGSAVSGRWTKDGGPGRVQILVPMSALIILLAAALVFQPQVLGAFETSGVAVRVMVSLFFLLPLGFLMGLPFPFGMALASRTYAGHTPWFWATNGAAGVVSSVLSVWISITSGFTATLAAGILFYLIATAALLALGSRKG